MISNIYPNPFINSLYFMTIKKKIDLLKTKDILTRYPIILIFQHNNLTVTDWSILKTGIRQYSDTKIFLIKNSIIEKILSTDENLVSNSQILTKSAFFSIKTCPSSKLQNLFQGPNFLLGCPKLDQLDSIWNFLKSKSNIIFIGGFYQNQVLTHLDLEKLLQLQKQGILSNPLLQQLFYTDLNANSNLIPVLNMNSHLNSLLMLKLDFLNSLNLYIYRSILSSN